MKLWRCRFCHKKIESENTPTKCPNCGDGVTHRKSYSRFSGRRQGKTLRERYTIEYFNPVAFHLIGELK